MIDQFEALLNIGDRSPAIGYSFSSPYPQWLPDDVLKKAHQNTDYYLSTVTIANRSHRTLQSVLVQLSLAPHHTPAIDIRNGTKSTWTYNADKSYCEAVNLEPGASLNVAIFLKDIETDQLQEPKVLIEGKVLSKAMRTAGDLKVLPMKLALMFAASMAVSAAAVAIAAYAFYQVSPWNPKAEAIRGATSTWQTCKTTAYEQTEVTPALLARHKLSEQTLLQMNRVTSRADLAKSPIVVICE